MSQRVSGFERQEADFYPTPEWVIDCLAEHVDLSDRVLWEPACGNGQMVTALEKHGASVFASDINNHERTNTSRKVVTSIFDFTLPFEAGPDFFDVTWLDGIVTNPPYGKRAKLAETFIERALEHTQFRGFVAMLLPVDFDSAKTRARMFSDCPRFAGKITLTKRIKWFDDPDKKSSPSANHAWFLWEIRPRIWIPHRRTAYAPSEVA